MPTFRGFQACPCQIAWLPVFEAEAQRRGIVRGQLPLSQLIGGAPASGGTHTGGGADDTFPLNGIQVEAYVRLSREMGADATWERPFNWDGRGGVRHVHRVLTGCPHNGPARYQIDAVRAGFNGLGRGGRGGIDAGPKPLSGRTWQEGIEWAEDQDVSPEQEDRIVAKVVKAILDEATVDRDKKVSVRQAINQTRNDAAKAAEK